MREKVLLKLKENQSNFVSGEKLSECLGVSRTAVWKYVNELRKEGYVIEASPKKGYKLVPPVDLLNGYELGYKLDTDILGRKIHYLRTVDSTNNYAKKLASEGEREGTVVVAETQTAGKGRLGRSWSSAGKKGIWMSLILRPQIPPDVVQIVTLAAAVAVVKAFEKGIGVTAGIKWPNDIILDGKKVCGILTEMSSEMEAVNFVVLGIGVNVNQLQEDFPDEVRSTAVSLRIYRGKHESGEICLLHRSEIIKKILFELEQLYIKINNSDFKGIIESWKRYSVTLGKEVRVILKNSSIYEGTAKDITKDGRLVIDCVDGVTRELLSGEVSVRGLLDYI